MDKYNFRSIKRSIVSSVDSDLHITTSYILTSLEAVEAMGVEFGDGQKVYFGYEIDELNKAIRISVHKNSLDGYVAEKKKGSKGIQTIVPADFKRAGMPRGDYSQVPEHPNVFVWNDPDKAIAKPKVNLEDDNSDVIEIGDIVSWRVKAQKGKNTNQYHAQGKIIAINDGSADILVESEEYKKWNPGRFKARIKISNLTIISKHL